MMASIEETKSKNKVHATVNIGEDQIQWFEDNCINFSKWLRKRLEQWIAEAKENPKLIEELKAYDDSAINLQKGRKLGHKTLSMDEAHQKFMIENKIDGKFSMWIRRTVDRFMDAMNQAELSMAT